MGGPGGAGPPGMPPNLQGLLQGIIPPPGQRPGSGANSGSNPQPGGPAGPDQMLGDILGAVGDISSLLGQQMR